MVGQYITIRQGEWDPPYPVVGEGKTVKLQLCEVKVFTKGELHISATNFLHLLSNTAAL